MANLIILRWNKEFCFNPLKPPPGVDLKVWRMSFCEITSENFGIKSASNLYLNESVQNLYDLFESEYPTIHDLDKELDKKKKAAFSLTGIMPNRMSETIFKFAKIDPDVTAGSLNKTDLDSPNRALDKWMGLDTN